MTENTDKCIALANSLGYNRTEVIPMMERAKKYVVSLLGEDASGHDHHHVFRVLTLAETIAEEETKNTPMDMEVVRLMALLHDVDDRKISPQTAENLDNARAFLRENQVPDHKAEMILEGIGNLSYKGTGSTVPVSAEGKCVQDADRLDALGAVGIARTFAFGGSRGRPIYIPEDPEGNSGHSIAHFYEKLLRVKDLMNTEAGKRIAEHRHAYMEAFLEEFYGEWEGER